ncbi:DUF3800 domain-containing protein [uncultured Xanthomonas sp.]|uniref:DUF3800 domain-containing protein n=1 Tax=uncultured Xanthomonas sp. TaxID=152831 RepID=UPI0025E9F38C|nr:DUF3800 domain-containing protein [uncultured Xanthomonas sp.]
MFFYVDESGHTGLNLFDSTQPDLFYGMLSSKVNLDVLAEPYMRVLRQRLGVKRLHAKDLGIGPLSSIAPALLELVDKYDIRFDLYKLVKADYAVIQFFDQVFDQGLNPAVGWTTYWTPLRYVMLLKVAHLFDDDLAQLAWAARTEKQGAKSESQLREVCTALLGRVRRLPDQRSRELITDTLNWAIANTSEIKYNADRKDMQLAISPNLIGFQFVLFGLVSRLKSAKAKLQCLCVDQQQQFNGAQSELADFYAKGTGQVFPLGPGLPELDLRGMPTQGPSFKSSDNSAGLELVDLILWMFKRIEDCAQDPAISTLMRKLMRRGQYDELSLARIEERWEPFFRSLEERPWTAEEMERGQAMMAMQEERRISGMTRALPRNHGRS